MRSTLTPSILFLVALTLGACDDDGISNPSDAPAEFIETGSFHGLDGSLGTDAMGSPADAAVPDAAVAVASDAGAPEPGDAGAALDRTCAPADCGAMPTARPTCFDGTEALVECGPWVDGTCSWQFVCGL